MDLKINYLLHHERGFKNGHSAPRQLAVIDRLRHHVPWLLRMCNEVVLLAYYLHFCVFFFSSFLFFFSPRAAYYSSWTDHQMVVLKTLQAQD